MVLGLKRLGTHPLRGLSRNYQLFWIYIYIYIYLGKKSDEAFIAFSQYVNSIIFSSINFLLYFYNITIFSIIFSILSSIIFPQNINSIIFSSINFVLYFYDITIFSIIFP